MGVFPRDDTFQEFSSHYGERLASYVRHQPWVTAGDFVTGYDITNGIGDLHNGYSGAFNTAAFKIQGVTGTDTRMGALLWRQAYLANAKASLTFKLLTISGPVTLNDFRFAGVCVRVSGGAYSDTTGAQYVRDTSGYWLMLACNPALASNLRYMWLLLRVNAGAITVLDFITASLEVSQSLVGAHQMSLEVHDVGGNPVLTPAYDGVVIVPLVYTDSSGSKITAAGRCGFGMTRDRQYTVPARTLVTIASRFTVFDVDAGSSLLVDDFTRVNTAANPSVTDGNSVTGKVLMSMWTLDVHGPTPWTAGSTQYRDPGQNRIDARGGTHNFSQIAAADLASQSRSVVFRKTANVAYATATGILLRGVMSNSATVSNGYLFTINYGSTTYTAVLRRYNSGVSTTIATADVSSGYGLAAGQSFTLLASVTNQGATPRLLMTIDGAGVENWTTLVSGVTTANNVHVLDGTAGAIQSGPAQSIQVIPFSSTADGHIYYTAWTDEIAPEITESENEPSLPVGSECDGKTGTLSVPVQMPFEVQMGSRVSEHRYETQHVARIRRDLRFRRRWRFDMSGASDAEKSALWSFWDGHGKEVPFDFVDPEGGETLCAHFADDSLSTQKLAPDAYGYSFMVEELLDTTTRNSLVPGTLRLTLTPQRPFLLLLQPGTAHLSLSAKQPLLTQTLRPGTATLILTPQAPILV